MTDPPETEPAPEGWHEVARPDFIVEKYDSREPTLFVREDRDVGVHVVPAAPNAPHSERHRWRVAYVEGDRDELDHVEPFESREGREEALRVAEAFMAAYDEHADLPLAERVERAKEQATAV